jgi:protein-S-isoprenylcysteine O-methyltransferase Ste14
MNALELKVPPPLVAVIFAALMWLAARLGSSIPLPFAVRLGGALLLVAGGIALSGAGARTLGRAGTTMNPMKPDAATTMVAQGIYRHTRNPMYVGLLLLVLAWAVYLANDVALLGLPAFVLYMNRFQIVPEERALTARFGASYTDYQDKVRRWF